jgi:hypothetical protein
MRPGTAIQRFPNLILERPWRGNSSSRLCEEFHKVKSWPE